MGEHFKKMFAKHGDLTPEEKAKKWFEVAMSEDYEGHDSMLPRVLKLESVTVAPTNGNPHNSRIVYSFTVPKELCNMGGHVSRNLNCTYLRPAAEGTKVYVISEVVHLGKRQGLTKGEIRLESEDGKIAYTCEHGKAAVGQSSL
ncbi:hypothetical protein N0V94_001907 [Neodidymelliopsis sp. IMI 364377]|nr:hypothetical protein N0V94_001907 [Neodidymelliopsis sp. IMI 364377]